MFKTLALLFGLTISLTYIFNVGIDIYNFLISSIFIFLLYFDYVGDHVA